MSKPPTDGLQGLSAFCNAGCADRLGELPIAEVGEDDDEDLHSPPPRPPNRPREGPVIFQSEPHLPLVGDIIRMGEVLHLSPDDGRSFRLVKLVLYPNGMSITPCRPGDRGSIVEVAWSPFSLVQACRLHSMQADECQPWMRLFKVSIFHHGLTHFFATQGDRADMERARWVADVSRTLRALTQSLFPAFTIRTDPHPGASWTGTRLLAGYLLLYDELGVSRVYGELHAHWDNNAAFAAYEDDCCDVQIVHLTIDMATCVSDRVGIDCSCFSLGDHHFAARSCAEKMLWLRAISNVKVKLRHWASNPSRTDLRHYRAAIKEHVRQLPKTSEEATAPLLPRRTNLPAMKPSLCSGIENDRSPVSMSNGSTGKSEEAEASSEPQRQSAKPFVAEGSNRSASNEATETPTTALMAAAAARLSQAKSSSRPIQLSLERNGEDSLPPSAMPTDPFRPPSPPSAAAS